MAERRRQFCRDGGKGDAGPGSTGSTTSADEFDS